MLRLQDGLVQVQLVTAPRRPLTLEDLDAVDAMTPPGQPGDKVDQAKASATVRRLTAALRSVMVDRDMWKGQATAMGKAALEAREQVRSLTVERDRETKRADLATSHLREVCAENSEAVGRLADALQERDDTQAERDALRARLSRAREALDRYDEEPPHYRAGLDEENAWRARQEAALADLRSALTEEAPHGQV